MTLINATTVNNPQRICGWWTYNGGNQQQWNGVRLVGWISQNVTERTTTLFFKWQRSQQGYYTYDLNTHQYSVTFGGQTRTNAFNLPQIQQDSVYDLTTVQSITVQHDSNGEYSGTLSASGYITWEDVSGDFAIEFPKIAEIDPDDPDKPEEEPTKPIPVAVDNDPRYYVYCDGNLVYAAGIEGYVILNPKLNLEVNKAGSFTFDIPVGSEMYGRISKMKSTVEVRQGNEVLFRGRLLNTKRNMMNTISCYCEGFLSWMNDIVFLPYTWNGQARDLLKKFIERYNLRATEDRKIEYKYSDISAKIKVEVTEHTTAFKAVNDVLVNGVGGYIVPYLDQTTTGIQWLSDYGTKTDQIIQFGKNLLDFEEYIDASQIFTAVRPYGKEVNGTRISLPEMFIEDQQAIETFGRIETTAFFDEIEDVNVLRTEAQKFLRTGINQAVTISLKAFDLHIIDADEQRIRLGNMVRSVSVPHSIDAYFLCTKMGLDLENPDNSTYVFGSTQRTISELTDTNRTKYVITEGA